MSQFLFLKIQRLIGSHVEPHYREFLDLEARSPRYLSELQAPRLQAILKHAVDDIPYYRERVGGNNQMLISDFPILTKEGIRDHFNELMLPSLREQVNSTHRNKLSYSWVEVKTGGSTGMPTRVIHDAEFRDRGRAGRLYSQHLCGFPFGTPYFRLWGSMKEINAMKDSFAHRVMSFLAKETLLNAFKMNDADIERYIHTINTSAGNHMMGYVDSAYEMARYALREGKRLRPLETIMACGGTVTDDIRKTLTEAFRARVHNKYGSRDCADMACECEAGGLHIYANNILIEVLDSQGNSLKPGQTGRIVVTSLFNYSFPLIRYEIGDIGVVSRTECSCGRPFPLLERLEGRILEFLTGTDGSFVTPVYIRHLIGVIHNPGCTRRFQLVQSSPIDYEVSMELERGVPDSVITRLFSSIRKDLTAVLGIGSNITVQRVSEIPSSASGKFLYTINKTSTTKAEFS